MTFAEFACLLVSGLEIRIDPAAVLPSDDLVADWRLDSFQLFQLVVIAEDLAKAEQLPTHLPRLATAGDAYAYYESMR